MATPLDAFLNTSEMALRAPGGALHRTEMPTPTDATAGAGWHKQRVRPVLFPMQTASGGL